MSVPGSKVDATSAGAKSEDAASPAGLSGQLESFVANAAAAMLVVDRDGVILLANRGVTSLFGYEERELLGRRMGSLIEDGFGDEAAARVSALLQPTDSESSRGAIEIGGTHKSGARLTLEIALTVLGPSHRDMAVWTLLEAGERKAAPERVGRSEACLNEAQRIAKIGSWEWDAINDEHWWSDELYRMLEIDPGAHDNFYRLFVERIHPDDRQRFEEISGRVLKTGVPELMDVRIILPDGSVKLVQSQGEVQLDASGRLVRVSGTLQDITERKSAEAALLHSESRYREAQRIAKLGNWEWNVKTNESWWSEELYSILEEDPATCEASLEYFLSKVHKDDRSSVLKKTEALTADPESPSDVRIVLDGGREKIVEVIADVRQPDEGGRPEIVSGTMRDVTDRRELERLLRESEDRYSSTVELAAIGIAHVDVDGRIVWANQHFCEMLGYSKDELLDRTVREISHPDDGEISTAMRADLHAGRTESLKFEKRYVRKNGSVVWVRITSTSRRGGDGEFLYDISAIEDISDRRAAEARVQYLATHDEMTGLPNRASFNESVNQAIEVEGASGCTVLFIDLDRFKIVNDSLGHEAGDLLLKEMASRLRSCVGESEVLARLGGDEFVVLLPGVSDKAAVTVVARKILNTALKPIEIMSQECRVTASIGIATFPDDARDAASLMKHADMAMYIAKEEGKNNFQFYSRENTPMTVESLALESHLSHALDRQELSVQYQAQVELETGEITGAEALLRWWNPELGAVPPSQFIPLAEDTGLIVPISQWVLRTACEQNVAWQRQGLPPIVVAVNLSPRQFKDPSLLDDISEALERSGMAPELLELEITESMIMHDLDRAVTRVVGIKDLGVRLAIDDFGTGYSSLSQLKRFPIDTLKIDRSFVRDIPGNVEDRAIIEAIISLGKSLGVTVIAEGVETAKQIAFLREQACDRIQGFHFSKPCHPDGLAELLNFRVGPRVKRPN